MPFSVDAFDYWVSTLFELLQPASFCDIGPGEGKYGKMARQKSVEIGFPCHTTAVEIDDAYVKEFKLSELYDEVIVADGVTLINDPRRRFDLVIIGDCLEHMRKSAGLDLLNFLVYRTGYICLIVPDALVQDDLAGHAAEAHISIWSMADFAGFDVLHKTMDAFTFKMNLYLIKGYQPTRMRITG